MALDLIAELEALVERLERDGISYAVCGGLAVAIHGHPRATMDIDVLLPEDEVPRAMEVARSLGFDIPARPMLFGRRTPSPRRVQRVSKIDADTGTLLSLDLIIADAGLAGIWQDRTVLTWRHRNVPVVSRDGLIAMKRLAGRPQDVADIAALEGSNADEDDAEHDA